jgi:hypothetical protein
LSESGEEESIARAHACYYLALVEEAEPHLKDAQQLLWLSRLDREQENLRTALGWLIAHHEGEKAMRFCISLWLFWETRGYWSEGRSFLKTVLLLPEAGEQTVVLSLSELGWVLGEQGDHAAAASLLKECIMLCRKLGSTWELSRSLTTLVEYVTGNTRDARPIHSSEPHALL